MSEKIGIKKAFILGGGKGERLMPLTKEIPKPLIEVKGKPILQYNIELVKSFGVEEIVLGLGYLSEKIISYFEKKPIAGAKIVYSTEKEFLGTAGALKLAEKNFSKEEKFIMMNGDELKDVDFEKLNALHEKNNAIASIALTEVEDTIHWGVVKLEKNKILEFVEKPKSSEAPSNLINSGAYILSGKIFELIPEKKFSSIEREIFPKISGQGKLFGCKCVTKWMPTDTIEKLNYAKKNW